MASNYVVTAPLVIARNEAGQDQYLYQGAALPDYVTDDARQRFIDDGLVMSSDDAAKADAQNRLGQTGQADATQEQNPATGDGSDAPKTADNKAAWTDYAVTKGATREEAESLTKEQLVERYGS